MRGLKIKALHSSSSGNLFILTAAAAPPLLLDCGIPFKKLQREMWDIGLSVGQAAGCLLTHCHSDHAKAAAKLAEAGVDVYTSAETAQALGLHGHHRVHTVTALEEFSCKGWRVLAFEAEHDAPGAYNYLIATAGDKVVYITDTAFSRYTFQGLTHIIIECNYDQNILQARLQQGGINDAAVRRIMATHMGLDTVKEFLMVNDLRLVQGIWLVHLSDANSDARLFKYDLKRLTGKPVYIVDK